MRKSIVIAPLIASAVVVLGAVAPASAATTAGTTLQFTEGTGAINITAPTGTVILLPALTPTTSAQTVSAAIGSVVVTDNQGNDTGWVASASATDFISGSLPHILASNAAYTTPGAIATVGTVTAVSHDLASLGTAAPVVTATGVVGANTATWTPTITLTVPGGTLPGTYTSTLTQSVV
jgi:hypothetical protein